MRAERFEFGDRLRHHTKNLVLSRDSAKALERADVFERFMQVRPRRRASPKIVSAPGDRLAPQVHEARPARRVRDPFTIAGQEQLPELLGFDRIADMRVERVLRKVVFSEDWRQQEWADRAPSLVDIDRGIRYRDQFSKSRTGRRKPQHRIVDEACPDRIGLAAKHEAVALESRLAQAEHVGIDPAAACLPHHSIAKHIGEVGEGRLAIGDESAE